MKENFYSLPFSKLSDLLKSQGLNEKGAALLFNSFYKKLNSNIEIPNLAKTTQFFLKEKIDFSLPQVSQVSGQSDALKEGETLKFLIKMVDGYEVECVLIPFQGKYTLCLSSQVGCAMKCSFCFTGTQGLTRSLKANEIVGQLMSVKHWLQEHHYDVRISNLVFMGQGEPLHNLEEVRKACDIFLSQYGLSLGREKITISTAGFLPGLKDWLESPLKVNLALSFHCPNDQVRSELIPLNQAYPVREILELLRKISLEEKRFITFEILLIKDLTDLIEYAQDTVDLIKDLNPLVNLIPFNPFPGSVYQRPEDEALENFRQVFERAGIPAMVRKTKGDEILAACGQLNSRQKLGDLKTGSSQV